MARVEMRRRPSLIGTMMVYLGDADGMICGTVGAYASHLRFIDEVIGKAPGFNTYAAMNILLLAEHTMALVDTHRSEEHTSELQSLMRISYAVFCLNKKKHTP